MISDVLQPTVQAYFLVFGVIIFFIIFFYIFWQKKKKGLKAYSKNEVKDNPPD